MGIEEELENVYEEGNYPYFSPILKPKEKADGRAKFIYD
jgi:hypothetical protein